MNGKKMKIERFECGELGENGYVVYHNDGGACYVIDPGEGAQKFLNFIDKHSLALKAVLLTHHHHDHTGAVDDIVRAKGCPVFIHEDDLDM